MTEICWRAKNLFEDADFKQGRDQGNQYCNDLDSWADFENF